MSSSTKASASNATPAIATAAGAELVLQLGAGFSARRSGCSPLPCVGARADRGSGGRGEIGSLRWPSVLRCIVDIARAEKKLRQATFFHAYLARPAPTTEDNSEHPEYWFSACLSSAKSVYLILRDSDADKEKFKKIKARWEQQLSPGERSRFERMLKIRDNDVHRGSIKGQALTKYVEQDRSLYSIVHSGDDALFPMTPMAPIVNPDGSTVPMVTGQVFRGVPALYLTDKRGGRVDAIQECQDFIDWLRSLLAAVKIAEPTSTAAVS